LDPAGEPNELYRNDGGFTFTPITSGALVNAPAGQGAAAVDYDNDGDLDIFAGNRTGPVNILQNNGNGLFTAITPSTIGIDQEARDGVSFADVNNDGWLDLMLNKHLFLATGGGQFVFSRTFESAVNHYMGGFADLDNDGDWDLAFPGNNYVYLNDGNGNFSASDTFSLGAVNDPRCVSFADIDQDGDLDFFYAQKRAFNQLVRNDLDNNNRWIKVSLQRVSGQIGAPGTRVSIYESGGLGDETRRIIWAEANAQQGYLAQNDPQLHLGVGVRGFVDILVEFPGGVMATATGVPTDSSYLIQESDPFRVVVLGSSTAEGTGASSPENSWAGLLDAWLGTATSNHEFVNLALGGATTVTFRPDGSPPPEPDTSRNITRALELDPDMIIINLPSNNVAQDIPLATTMVHYGEIRAPVDSAGVPLYVTTTQPRNFADPAKRLLLEDEANAVRSAFGANVIDIYDELTDFVNGRSIKATYDSGDGTHLNDAGHAYIYSTTRDLIAPSVPP
jgi:lysophospholipase L1-like esterase